METVGGRSLERVDEEVDDRSERRGRALEWPGYYGIVTREGKVLVWKSAKSARRSKRILSNFDFQVHPS